jgi:putative inorganic carbon (HCO3(-)) transporter
MGLGNLAAMCQVSLIGYVVGGAFLTLAYVDLMYDIVASLSIT